MKVLKENKIDQIIWTQKWQSAREWLPGSSRYSFAVGLVPGEDDALVAAM